MTPTSPGSTRWLFVAATMLRQSPEYRRDLWRQAPSLWFLGAMAGYMFWFTVGTLVVESRRWGYGPDAVADGSWGWLVIASWPAALMLSLYTKAQLGHLIAHLGGEEPPIESEHLVWNGAPAWVAMLAALWIGTSVIAATVLTAMVRDYRVHAWNRPDTTAGITLAAVVCAITALLAVSVAWLLPLMFVALAAQADRGLGGIASWRFASRVVSAELGGFLWLGAMSGALILGAFALGMIVLGPVLVLFAPGRVDGPWDAIFYVGVLIGPTGGLALPLLALTYAHVYMAADRGGPFEP